MDNNNVKQHELLDTTKEFELCSFCGKSVAWGSGKYVNRIPDLNEKEIRLKMGRPFPEGEFVCADCDVRTENE
ncbi:hypothetical protein METP3_02101 [Methanosarcinales archaeon]|nr:hypothetical protein METP3_02101 [Methanosarcinales archaeon]